MIGLVCAYVHNYFETDPVTGRRRIYSGTYTITDGVLNVPFLAEGQYFRVFGSRKNDGVYRYHIDELRDETFTGVIWEMRPPRDFLALVEEISAWVEKYGEAAASPYQSEDVIGVYRYTKDDSGGGWESIFRDRLKQYTNLY
jgi:hypothetical protein